jgi:hypothetical protein
MVEFRAANTTVDHDAASQTTRTVSWWTLSDADLMVLSSFISLDGEPVDLWNPAQEDDPMILDHYLIIKNRVLYDVEIRYSPQADSTAA